MRWKALNVAYFCEKFGPNVVSIVEHLDEKHGHLHVLVSAGGRSVKPLHPGYAASVPLRQAGATQAADRTHTRPRRVRGRMSTRRRWRRLVGWLGLGLVVSG